MEDYIIIGLLVVVIALIVYTLLVMHKNKGNSGDAFENQKDIQNEFKVYLQKEYGELKFEMGKLFNDASKTNQNDLNVFKDNMMLHIDRQMKEINDRVENRLGEGFKKTEATFVNVVERLSKIDEAQKKIESLSTEVVSLNTLLTDKKTRGIYGEVQLYSLLSAVLGDNKELYEKQKTMSNGFIADAVVYAPDPINMVAIDSKFPLDNYKRMVNRALGDADRKNAEKEFKNDVKKHINDIKNKYIIFNETGDQAFMFIPAEAIFAEISAHHDDLIEYASKNKVWLVSPTTLISTLTMIQMVVNNLERDKQAKVIIEELAKLGEEFRRYSERWDKLKKSIDSVSNRADLVHKTSSKINRRFEHISNAKFDLIEDDETEEIEEEIEDIVD